METDTERLRYEFVTLTAAIEEAMNKGHKSIQHLDDIPRLSFAFNRDFAITYMNAGSEIVGWVDDF